MGSLPPQQHKMTTTSSVASISAADVAFYDAAARKRMLGLKLIIRAIDGSLYQAEADEDIQLFIRSETLFDQERTRFQHRHSGVCIPCCYLCNILLCISDPCNNPYPKSRTKEQVIVGMGVSKPYWRASELLHMTALLHDGLQRLQQHGPGQLCAAHAECDAQERMAFKRGPLPMGGPAPSSQAPYGGEPRTSIIYQRTCYPPH